MGAYAETAAVADDVIMATQCKRNEVKSTGKTIRLERKDRTAKKVKIPFPVRLDHFSTKASAVKIFLMSLVIILVLLFYKICFDGSEAIN